MRREWSAVSLLSPTPTPLVVPQQSKNRVNAAVTKHLKNVSWILIEHYEADLSY